MEPIIAIVGFLGAGKTTLLNYLLERAVETGWQPYVILNDYENAFLDAQRLPEIISPRLIKPLTGSCICCSGISELRASVNRIPTREHGITFIEANGTSDASALMGFLGVGIDARFSPPVQISVVDVSNWQMRGEHNELEANQIQVSSLIVLSHLDEASVERRAQVVQEIEELNPLASIMTREQVNVSLLSRLSPSNNTASTFEHRKSHWASCSIDLPVVSDLRSIKRICDALPASILRVKGCTRVGTEEQFTYFERCPDGKVYVRPYRGVPETGPKLLVIGPGSTPKTLEAAISQEGH